MITEEYESPAKWLPGLPESRAGAAFKPVFFVPSLSAVRGLAETLGGRMEPADRQWSFNGVTVCDALVPEGNVVQFRELTSAGRPT